MSQQKSERLKKLETELEDLQQWLKLGLVPKKDLTKHQEEITLVLGRIDEEKERLRFLKENGEMEEYVAPKRSQGRSAYPEAHTFPDMDLADSNTELGFDMETEGFDTESATTESGESEDSTFVEEDDDPFSDRNRWKRGVLESPDSDNWS